MESGLIEKAKVDKLAVLSDIVPLTVTALALPSPLLVESRECGNIIVPSRALRPELRRQQHLGGRPTGRKVGIIISLSFSAFGWQLGTSEQRHVVWAKLRSTRKPSVLISEAQLWR